MRRIAVWQDIQQHAALEVELHEAAQPTELFREWSGSAQQRNQCSRSVKGENTIRDTFRQGYQVWGRLKLEHFETFQVIEPL